MTSNIPNASDYVHIRDSQGWSASLYNKSAAFVYSPAFTAPVLELLSAQPGEKIIDLGCGSGEVTVVIDEIVKKAPGGLVVAVDYSESMIAKAKEAGLDHAFVSDIQKLDIPISVFNNNDADFKFDAAFSNATFHWCKSDPAGVLEGIRKILKPGGRLAVEMGGAMNCIGLRSALHRALKSRGYDPIALDPWFFPSVEEYTKLLIAASFEPLEISIVPRITPLADGIRGWLEVFARKSILKDCPDSEATEIIDEVEEVLKIDCQDGEGNWSMVYARLRFSAILK
ncbi:S-adenosyl-L-methionine-dependent methyltransferase [Mycena albidolilacea]|uniref:S-adenosyl-L-methionine-dependent methyltransferase n=1 Tax=Mycena albidolilacea TaxID=1033008 RepID=A0AAD7ARK9_9AGAR|nr:S-adenosyl-L-methionine-dependent methyltransferase [Mycena albidolilacea]